MTVAQSSCPRIAVGPSRQIGVSVMTVILRAHAEPIGT